MLVCWAVTPRLVCWDGGCVVLQCCAAEIMGWCGWWRPGVSPAVGGDSGWVASTVSLLSAVRL